MQKNVAKAISTFEDRQKAEARTKVESVTREMGYSLAGLIGTDSKPKRIPAAPKYQRPENADVTWSGRVRKPQWFVDAMAAGTTIGDPEVR